LKSGKGYFRIEEEGNMKRSSFPAFIVLSLMLVTLGGLALAETKVLIVPKGTVFEQVGPQQFRLRNPEGCVFEIKGFQKTGKGQVTLGEVGIIGDCGIYDKNGKIIATGTKGILKSGPKAIIGDTGKALKDVPASDLIKIDIYTIWLPATIEFTPVRIFNRPALVKLCSAAESSANR
jgi:hypothetical protein